MIDLSDQSVILFGTSPEIPDNKNYTKMRKTVYEAGESAKITAR